MASAQYPNQWYVITGGPSTGKTMVQQAMTKHGFAAIDEAARLVIDDGVAKGLLSSELREDEKSFQEEVVKRRVTLEAAGDPATPTFLDRGMPDSLAYLRYYDFEVASWIKELLDQYRYKQVFLMEPLGIFKQDYARTESLDFTDYITDLLIAAYTEYGMPPILVPPVGVEERVTFILERLNKS